MTDNDNGKAAVEDAESPEEIGASIVEQASDGIKQAAHGVGVVYEQARKPGMPLSILSNIAREAPLLRFFGRSGCQAKIVGSGAT